MPSRKPYLHDLRMASCVAIERLLMLGACRTYKDALAHIIIRARGKKLRTGFEAYGSDSVTFEACYRRYITFRSAHKDELQHHLCDHLLPTRRSSDSDG